MARRASALVVGHEDAAPLGVEQLAAFDDLDAVYRALCAILYNYVPTSGHPGGSISSGRIIASALFDALDYDLSRPERDDADVLCFAAGHKAMGLYAMWALRDEIARQGAAALVAPDVLDRLRLEDLLGFRTNPTVRHHQALYVSAKALDGHPTPATPFVRLASGASGVGMASAIGLAIGLRDRFGAGCPRVHILEGEGGLTPGRVGEALAAAGTSSLGNIVAHIDFNQSSIDSDRVCRDEHGPGDYVQWDPAELFALHDWNVLQVDDGHDAQAVVGAQRQALAVRNGQPTAVIYRTTKGWHYGIEGRASHGSGHGLCAEGFYRAVAELGVEAAASLPRCDPSSPTCSGPGGPEIREECFTLALAAIRHHLEERPGTVEVLASRLLVSRERLGAASRRPRSGAPKVEAAYELARSTRATTPAELGVEPGQTATLRETLGRALGLLNRESAGAVLTASADLLGSTSASLIAAGFPPGFFNAETNPDSRVLSIGGICEDSIAGVLSGVAASGCAIGVGSSYGAFMAPLGHIAARLHAIGAQARRGMRGVPFATLVLICGHAGLATGEDGPTHADPQAFQLFAENFPLGAAVTITPWEPQELWPLLATALALRPALLAPFVPRPAMQVPDRAALGLAPPSAAVEGVYPLREADGDADVTIVVQESAVTTVLVTEVLPMLESDGIDARVYHVSSPELFDALPADRRAAAFPEEHAQQAIGITGFTLPTMYRWVCSQSGRAATLHPFRDGHYLGSGTAASVLGEAGLDADAQYAAVRKYVDASARGS